MSKIATRALLEVSSQYSPDETDKKYTGRLRNVNTKVSGVKYSVDNTGSYLLWSRARIETISESLKSSASHMECRGLSYISKWGG